MESKEKRHPDIIDNRDTSMSYVLNTNMDRIDYLDISSGYFDVSGYGMIRQELETAAHKENFKLRLLLGRNAINPPEYETFEDYQNRAKSIKDELDSEGLNKDGRANVAGLIKLLKQNNVHVRHNDHKFNHSKCYILGDEGAIVGSSNFTYSGFHGNDELNVGVYQTSTWKKIKEWYDRMWSKSSDAKEEIIQVLEQSKFGIPPDPYYVYIKMLFEMHKLALLAIEEEKPGRESKLANFQKDAVSAAIQIMSVYGGVFIADATGLGKTHMGIEIMHQKVYGDRRRVLLVAPAQVLGSVWRAKLRDAGILAETVTMEKLGRKDFLEKYSRDVRRYAKCDLVVVDESQNFRSKNANRRKNLMQIMSFGKRKKKQVVLLSATPINNSIMDLYYQISIITGQNDSYFWDISIPNLYRHMKSAATREGLGEGLEKIHQILNAIMIRRTRLSIKDMYEGKAMLDGKAIQFPEREYQPINYKLSDAFGNIYRVLADAVESLKMAPYGIEQYNTELSDVDRKKYGIIARLQVIHMLKRFESSTEAVMISIDNKIKLYEYFEKVLKKNKIFSVKQFNKIMIKLKNNEDDSTEEENENFFMSEIQKIPTCSTKNYDVKKIQDDVGSDLKTLKDLQAEIRKMVKRHEKFNAVAETIREDKALESESKKVLIFTEYADTAKYLEKMMRETFGDKRTLLITGNTKPEKRQDHIERFAPVANIEDGKLPTNVEQADILISTEVLAEGQNLQDCNYVINYDLPWNPMRIVQRVGRIDRLTSKYNIVRSRACFPEKKLEELIELVGKLLDKINTVGVVIGLDGEVLGEDPEPSPHGKKSIFNKSITRISTLAGPDSNESDRILQTLEHEDALMPDASFNEISKYIKKEGIKKMKSVPMGRRSGKRKTIKNATKAILAYIIEEPRRFYTVAIDLKSKTSQNTLDYFGKKYQAKMLDDNTEALREAACALDTHKHLPDDSQDNHESFEMLLAFDGLARDTIKNKLETNAVFAQKEMGRRNDSYNKIVSNIKEKITGSPNQMTEEQGDKALKIIESYELRSWESRLKEIYSEYANNIGGMLEQLDILGKNIGVFEGLGQDEEHIPTAPDVADLKLVGAMFLSD